MRERSTAVGPDLRFVPFQHDAGVRSRTSIQSRTDHCASTEPISVIGDVGFARPRNSAQYPGRKWVMIACDSPRQFDHLFPSQMRP